MLLMTRLVGLVLAAGTLGGLHAASAGEVAAPMIDAGKPKVPSITVEVRVESLEKEVDVAVAGGPRGASAGLNVFFDRKGAFGNPELIVTPSVLGYSPELSVYFNNPPGPVSGPAIKLIHRLCDRSHGLC